MNLPRLALVGFSSVFLVSSCASLPTRAGGSNPLANPHDSHFSALSFETSCACFSSVAAGNFGDPEANDNEFAFTAVDNPSGDFTLVTILFEGTTYNGDNLNVTVSGHTVTITGTVQDPSSNTIDVTIVFNFDTNSGTVAINNGTPQATSQTTSRFEEGNCEPLNGD
jgi:hypothetical protein